MKLPYLLSGEQKKLFIRLLVNGLLQACAAIAFAWTAQSLFDTYVINTDSTSLQALVGASMMLILSLLIAALRRWERIDAEIMGQLYVQKIRKRLFARIINSQQRVNTEHRHGLILMRFVGDLNAIRQWVSLGLARLSVAGVSITITVAALAGFHWWFSVLIGTSLLLTAGTMWWQGIRLERTISEARKRQAYIAANMTEKVSQASVVQIFGQAKREQRYLAKQNQRLITAAKAKAAAIGSLRAIVEIGGSLAFVGALLLAAYAVQSGTATAGVFIAVFSIVGFLGAPMRDIGRAHEYWLAYRVATSKLLKMTSRLRPLQTSKSHVDMGKIQGNVELSDVSVKGALHSINTSVKAGQRIALVGENGSGKSTLLGILAGLVEPDTGHLLIDDTPLAQIPPRQLRQSISLVSSEISLIRGSVKKNILYGANKVPPSLFKQVLDQCGVTPILENLPQGLDTRIAEKGANFSQGERARICLARALLRRPKILLLDEADAHLDAPTSAAFEQVIETFSGTLFIVTHRRQVLDKADVIWHLHQGQLIAEGNTRKLLDFPGPTQRLFAEDLKLVS